MTDTEIVRYYNRGHTSRGADALKFFLMPFVMFVLFGFPTRFGGYVQLFSNFAAPAFFILSGFFVLCPNEQRRTRKIKRALKKTFKTFALIFVSYLIINAVFLLSFNTYWIPELLRKRTLFDFFVLNIWPSVFPMGSSIWFIQSLLYAYIFFYAADKIKLLRFYVPLLIFFYLVMLFVGEFAAILGFPHFGYGFIPGGAVTRAIPYMLLGMLIRQNAGKLLTLRRRTYIFFIIAGIGLAVLEYFLLKHFGILVYFGHMIGFGVMAASLCCLALSATKTKNTAITVHGRGYAMRIYALCQPVNLFITVFMGLNIVPKYFGYIMEYKSIIIYFVCLALSILLSVIKNIKLQKNA